MHIHYILLVHRAPAQVARLVQSLQGAGTSFYLHIDKKVDGQPFRDALHGVENLTWLENRQTCIWGDISIVRATLLALEAIVKTGKEGYCVLLSGQDYPVRSNAAIRNFLQNSGETCFIDANPVPYKNWNNNEKRLAWYKMDLSPDKYNYVFLPPLFSRKFFAGFRKNGANLLLVFRMKKRIPLAVFKPRRFPSCLKPYGGSQWWAVPVSMAGELLRFLERYPGCLAYFRWTTVPDEMFFHSVFRHLLEKKGAEPAEPITYTDWERSVDTSPVTFTSANWEQVKALPQNILFARKFDAEKDSTILDRIDHYLRADGKAVIKKDSAIATAKK